MLSNFINRLSSCKGPLNFCSFEKYAPKLKLSQLQKDPQVALFCGTSLVGFTLSASLFIVSPEEDETACKVASFFLGGGLLSSFLCLASLCKNNPQKNQDSPV